MACFSWILDILRRTIEDVVRVLGSKTSSESEIDIEEGIGSYHVGGFHPVHIGEIYGLKYRVLRKLGYGQYSTVWLVREMQTREFFAMKILSASSYTASEGHSIFELEILQHLKRQDTGSHGTNFITMLEDHFEHEGPHGRHQCLLFQVMGESLTSFREWFANKQLPSPMVQKYTRQLLEALSSAHRCGIIHTDIQPGNIMMRNPDPKPLLQYLEQKYPDSGGAAQLSSRSVVVQRSEPLRYHYFGGAFNLLDLNVALADWGVASWIDKHLTEDIQPILLRAPEVILEAPWNQSVDLWNLGALLPELIFGQLMFSASNGGHYSPAVHLQEISTLLGPLPPQLLAQARLKDVHTIFDDNGNLRNPKSGHFVSLIERFEHLTGGEGPKLEAFIRSLLTIDSGARPSASGALDAPWLSHKYTKHIDVERVQ